MKVSSWNIEGRLSCFATDGQRGSSAHIIQEIQSLNSDIIFLPEAFDQDKRVEPENLEWIKSFGYEIFEADYSEKEDRKYAAVVKPHMMILSRLNIENFHKARLGDSRNMIALDVTDPSTEEPIRLFGVHLDDRSEKGRLDQIDKLILCINESEIPVIVMGDFNAMYRDSLPALILRNRVVRALIDAIPHAQTKDILNRLSEMAIGDTLHRIQAFTNLTDADPRSQLTTTPKMRGQEWIPSIRLAQIDHILVSPEIEVDDFFVAKDGGSDHRAVSATISVARQNKPPVL